MFELFGYFAFMLLGLWLDQKATTLRQGIIAICLLFASAFCFAETLVVQILKLVWFIFTY
jgi:hypothetical protein